ncbi:hypothetical protein Rsub_08683 [Raphidocelis subcapitata]|uniref:Uncharacterized protein n=1 Tax=Raphidocelis subcapitata TaxID=307507 RepID=A0A2V0P750_9CHLO|nr:hypothetical protein Rsub_08683 [Raphidocelis subcapitata]|eukprot:GBF95701.1 hypothetical protein Rsub_08683 [Raphidocelis subcapitata]
MAYYTLQGVELRETSGEDFSTVVKSGTLTIAGSPPAIEVDGNPVALVKSSREPFKRIGRDFKFATSDVMGFYWISLPAGLQPAVYDRFEELLTAMQAGKALSLPSPAAAAAAAAKPAPVPAPVHAAKHAAEAAAKQASEAAAPALAAAAAAPAAAAAAASKAAAGASEAAEGASEAAAKAGSNFFDQLKEMSAKAAQDMSTMAAAIKSKAEHDMATLQEQMGAAKPAGA